MPRAYQNSYPFGVSKLVSVSAGVEGLAPLIQKTFYGFDIRHAISVHNVNLNFTWDAIILPPNSSHAVEL